MRQTVNLALVTGVLLALGATAEGADAGPGGVAAPPPARAEPAAAPDGRQPAVMPDGRQPTGGPEPAGTVEQVGAGLGYLDEDRSMTLHYPGAGYVKVHLAQLRLLPGDYVTVADRAGEEVHRYAAGRPDGLWAMSVTGDTAVVTLHGSRPGAAAPELGVTVDKVARGLPPGDLPPDGLPPGGGTAARPVRAAEPRQESICGTDDSSDTACYRSSHPTVYRNTKAVVRLLIDGVDVCTAFRVGPDNRLLTNHHCVSDSRQARRTEVWFNYQCVECGGWAVYRPTKVWGDRVLDTDQMLDYTLFTVDGFGAVERYGYLELAPRAAAAGEEIYIPQHPRGLPTRVSGYAQPGYRDPRYGDPRYGDCTVADPRAYGLRPHTDVSYYCDTAGGSSGSPVLSRHTHRVIALHHLGGCPNSGVRMDLIHPRIAPLL